MAELELIKSFSPYVPALILNQVAERDAPIESPCQDRLTVAVMFADISGFTPLTERLAQEGDAGAEHLTEILNTYFGRLIELVIGHGGDVLKFAGDALMATWTCSSESELREMTARATRCGLDVQEQLKGYTVGDDIHLGLKVTIGSGMLVETHIGGVFNRWELVIAGDPINQVGRIGDQANSGDVLISSSAWALLNNAYTGSGNAARGEFLDGGAVRVLSLDDEFEPRPLQRRELPESKCDAVRGYLPGAIVSRMLAGQTDWLGELRRLTILFINLPDLNYETTLADAQNVMRSLQEALYRYEGSINKLSVDDKGVSLVAALGLPPLSHEDDEARGVRAAMAMQGALRDLKINSSIGVTSGRVFCGAIGSDLRREYTLMGDMVNLSARLMQAAKGGILVDEETHNNSANVVKYADVQEISVKGKAATIRVYKPLGEVQRNAEPPMRRDVVGRHKERTKMALRLQDLLRGKGSTVVLEGEAGIGKSSLVDEFIFRARELGCEVFFGAADAIEKYTPYYMLQGLLEHYLGLDRLSEEPERLAAIGKLIPEDSEEHDLIGLLSPLLGVELPESEQIRQMSSEVRASNLHLLLVRLFQQLADRKPLVIIIEDIHWLDSASWAALTVLQQRVQPLLLMIASRPYVGKPPPEYQEMVAAAGKNYIRLTAMSEEDALALVRMRLGVSNIPDLAARLICERAEGHPFFSEELGYAMRDAGVLEIADGVASMRSGVTDLANIHLPDTIEGLITARIDRLDPNQQFTLKIASVIGRVFSLSVLVDVHPMAPGRETIEDYLRSLASLELTPKEAVEPEVLYIFKHIITQEVAYDMMLYSQRQQLHRVIAQWFENAYARDLSAHYPLLAHHWGMAGVSAKAVDYLALSAEQAVASYANREAIGFVEQAFVEVGKAQLELSDERKAHWLRLKGMALKSLGRFPEARLAFESALYSLSPEYAIPERPLPLIVMILKAAARQFFNRIRPPVVREGKANGLALEAAACYDQLIMIYYMGAEEERMALAILSAVNLAESNGEKGEIIASAGSVLATVLAVVKWVSQGEYYAQRSLALAYQVGHTPVTTWVLLAVSAFEATIGRFSAAIAHCDEAATLAKDSGDVRRLEELFANWGTIVGILGRYTESRKIYAQLAELGQEQSDDQACSWGIVGQFRIAVCRRELSEAAVLEQQSVDLLARLQEGADPLSRFDVQVFGCLLRLHRGDTGAARKQFAELLDFLAGQGRPNQFHLMQAVRALAEVSLWLWREDPAGAETGQLVKRARRYIKAFAATYICGRPVLALMDATMAHSRNKTAAAVRAYQQSLAIAQQTELLLEQHHATWGLLELGVENDLQGHSLRQAWPALRDAWMIERHGNDLASSWLIA